MSVPALVHQHGGAPARPQVEIGTVGASLALQSQPWPLSVAASLLQPYFHRENLNPDLADFVASRTVECHCAPDLMHTKAFTPFKVTQKPLPPQLPALNTKDVQTGFLRLGEKGSLWISTSTETYLWNLSTHTVKKFGTEVVTAMDIIPANKAVFSETVDQMLVVGTKEKITIYAIDKTEKLFDTGLSIPISGLGVPIIRASSGGRIFFTCSHTGTALFEFRYSSKESWFSPKVKRVCHGEFGGFLGGLFGTHTVSKDSESVRSMHLDDSVNAIYVLTSRSAVHVYSFVPNGVLVSLVENMSFNRIIQGLRTMQYAPQDEELVSICAISKQESREVRLVALTSIGSRVFFRSDRNMLKLRLAGYQLMLAPSNSNPNSTSSTGVPGTGQQGPHGVQNGQNGQNVQNVPGIPGVQTTYGQNGQNFQNGQNGQNIQNGSGVPGVHTSAYSNTPNLQSVTGGHFGRQAVKPQYKAHANSKVVSSRVSHVVTSANTVFSSCIDLARVYQQHDLAQPLSYVELTGFFNFDGELIQLTKTSESTDILLTSTGLYFVNECPFSDRFESADVSFAVAQVYGPMQICCGALKVASHSGSRYCRENAIAAYFRFGGLPMFKRDQVQAGFLNDMSIRLSALFDGLALYLAQLLKPVWNTLILRPKTVFPNSEQLNKLYKELSLIVSFLDRNRSFSEGMNDRSGYSNSDDAAVLSQAEYKGLQCLGRLARGCQEGVAFIRLVLTEHDSTQVLSYFDAKRLEIFKKMTFGELFTVDKDSEVVKELVNSLVNCVLNQGSSLDQIAATIQDLCPTYCSSAEVLEYKALEFIHQAKEQREPDKQSLQRSLKLVCQAAPSIQVDTLQDIVKDYVSMHFYTGAVQSALAVAAEQDPANLAIGFLRSNANASNGSSTNNAGTSNPGNPGNPGQGHSLAVLDSKRRVVQTVNVETNLAEMHAIPVSLHLAIDQPQGESEAKYKCKTRIYQVIFDLVLKPHPELADPECKDKTRKIMLDSNDEVWHFAFYDWLLNNNREDQVSQLDTPFIANYLLLGAAKDLRIANLLWKWYQRHGDLLAAADVLLDLARGRLATSLSQRVEFLSRAMTYCQAQTQQTEQAVNMTTMVRAYLGLALIQTSIQAQCDDIRLNTQIFTVTDLYYLFAKPLMLYDVCFELIKFTDLRDPVIVESCWLNMLDKERGKDYLENSQHYARVKCLVSQMGAKYGDYLAIFDPAKLVPMLEQYAVEYTQNSPSGWIVDALVDAGVDLKVLDAVYARVLRNKLVTGDAVEHAIESYKYLRSQWERADPLGYRSSVAVNSF